MGDDQGKTLPGENVERFRAYFEASTNGLFVYGPDGRLTDINPAACTMHGYSREQMLAMDPRDFIAPESHHVFDAFRACVLAGDTFKGEAQGLRVDGSRFDVVVEGRLITVGGEQFLFSSLIDVSERNALADQLRHAQRMEAIGQLAGGIAHDFNNLLSVILGYGQLVSARLADDDLKRDVGAILQAGDRARTLVQRLLAFSRRQTLRTELVELNAFLEDQASMLRRVLPETITIAVESAVERATVRIDRGQFEQVVLNLAINARQAMPEGGTLLLELEPIHLDRKFAERHQEVSHGDHFLFSVSDTGVGMDRDTQARIFEPFFSTKTSEEGTGLGLAMVYGTVKQHRGHITVYSEPGRGSTFKIYLPVAAGTASASRGTDEAEIVGGTEHLLVVEDNAQLRRLIVRLLTSVGYRVLAAADAQEAMLMTHDTEPVDLLLTDVVLPGRNGRELFDELRQRYATLKVLYMSGYSANVVSHQGILEQGVHFISKPFDLSELAIQIRRALEGPPG